MRLHLALTLVSLIFLAGPRHAVADLIVEFGGTEYYIGNLYSDNDIDDIAEKAAMLTSSLPTEWSVRASDSSAAFDDITALISNFTPQQLGLGSGGDELIYRSYNDLGGDMFGNDFEEAALAYTPDGSVWNFRDFETSSDEPFGTAWVAIRVTSVPEPSSFLMFGLATVGCAAGCAARRRRKRWTV